MNKLLSNRWAVFLLILPHITIYFFKTDAIKPFIQTWQLGVLLPVLLFLYTRVTLLNGVITLSMIFVLISAYFNGTLTGGIVYSIGVFIGFCFYISYAMSNFRELITGLYYLLVTIVVVNFLTMIATPLQFDGRFLLGGKNSIQLTLLPAISLIYLYSYFVYNKLKKMPLIIILLAILSLYLSESGTAIVISVLTLLFVIAPKKISPSFNQYLITYIIAFFSIVIFRLQEVIFGDFIRNVLNKDLTFTGRTYIWDFVLYVMNGSWFLGLGRGNTLIGDHNFVYFSVNETHNGGLEVLMYSGFVGLALFLIALLVVGISLKPYRNHVIGKVLAFSIFAYMIIGLTESVFYRIEFWVLLVIAFSIEKIIKQMDSPAQEERVINQAKLDLPIKSVG